MGYNLLGLPVLSNKSSQKSEMVQDIRDRIVCNRIISQDDLLTDDDALLFMTVLRALDFLYYTVLPSLITFAILYILSG